MKKAAALITRFTRPRILTYAVFALCLLFQAMVITKLVFLYAVFKVLLAGLVLLLLAWLGRAAVKDKVVVLVILVVVLVRLPFLFHPTGLMTMSDNALEALQSREIQASRTVPFYQFETLKHQGTLRYLLVAQTWDFTGPHYIVLILWNLAVFIAIILLLAKVLEPVISRAASVFLSLLSFMFIETMFDFSLLIRGGIYLDALFLVLLAVSLFDFQLGRRSDIVLSFYFMGFAFYIQPISLMFTASFILCAAVFSLAARRFWKSVWLFLAGGFLGIAHVLYYELFFPAKPAATHALEQVRIIPLASVSWRLIGNAFRYARESFQNLFRYEVSYFLGRPQTGQTEKALGVLNTIGLWVGLAVFLAGLGLALAQLVGLLRKKTRLEPRHWPYLFFLVLTLGFMVKHAALLPPRFEPRHNFDLLLLVVLAFYFVLTAVFRGKKLFPWTWIAAGALLAAVTVPHYHFFLKNTIAKEASYRQLMAALTKYKVEHLTTDFNLAYPVRFLSREKILCSDSIGPLRLGIFFPEQTAAVDALPDRDKSYAFFSEASGTREWHKRATRKAMNQTLTRLRDGHVEFTIVSLKDYTLIIPKRIPPEHSPQGSRP